MLQLSRTHSALCTRGPHQGKSFQFLRVAQMLGVALGLLTLCPTAQAQVEPAAPGSIEYGLLTNHYTWVQTSDPITTNSYVYDLLSSSRLGQPAGRGTIGVVEYTAWDADYNCMAAMVDFGRDYSAGIVFPELSSVQLVAVPEPSSLVFLLFGVIPVVLRRPGRARTNS